MLRLVILAYYGEVAAGVLVGGVVGDAEPHCVSVREYCLNHNKDSSREPP